MALVLVSEGQQLSPHCAERQGRDWEEVEGTAA